VVCCAKVVWSVPEDSLVHVRGFQVRYQAIGSSVVQYSGMLSSSTFSHYITRLHENTAYDVCVTVFTVDEVMLYHMNQHIRNVYIVSRIDILHNFHNILINQKGSLYRGLPHNCS